MRKVLGVLAAVAVLATTACTPASTPTPTPPAADQWSERGPITFAAPEGASETYTEVVDAWNVDHPNEQVTTIELPVPTSRQYSELVDRAKAKSGEFTIMALDVSWLTEFGTNEWLTELPAARFPVEDLLKQAVGASTVDGKLVAYPLSVDAGLFYYRKDLLERARLKPPTTWAELRSACAQILADQAGMNCYAGQLASGEDLTSNVAEAIASANGYLVDAAGKPLVDSSAAASGLQWLVDGVEAGIIPRAALTWRTQDSRQAFEKGQLLFLRHWWPAWHSANRTDSSSIVAGKVGVAVLPGKEGPGIATVSGRSLGIATAARNKGTAADFIAYLTSDAVQRRLLERGVSAPALAGLYDDADLLSRDPSLQALDGALATGRPLPATPRFSEVSQAIDEAGAAVLQQSRTVPEALEDLQARLEELLE